MKLGEFWVYNVAVIDKTPPFSSTSTFVQREAGAFRLSSVVAWQIASNQKYCRVHLSSLERIDITLSELELLSPEFLGLT